MKHVVVKNDFLNMGVAHNWNFGKNMSGSLVCPALPRSVLHCYVGVISPTKSGVWCCEVEARFIALRRARVRCATSLDYHQKWKLTFFQEKKEKWVN